TGGPGPRGGGGPRGPTGVPGGVENSFSNRTRGARNLEVERKIAALEGDRDRNEKFESASVVRRNGAAPSTASRSKKRGKSGAASRRRGTARVGHRAGATRTACGRRLLPTRD